MAQTIFDETREMKKQALTQLCHLGQLSKEKCSRRYASLFGSIELLGRNVTLIPKPQPIPNDL
jgi:hypothetical protein